MLELDTTIGIRVNNSDVTRLKKLAKKQRVPMATLCRSILATHLEKQQQ